LVVPFYSPKTDEGERQQVFFAHAVGGTRPTCRDVAMEEDYDQVKSVCRFEVILLIDISDTAI